MWWLIDCCVFMFVFECMWLIYGLIDLINIDWSHWLIDWVLCVCDTSVCVYVAASMICVCVCVTAPVISVCMWQCRWFVCLCQHWWFSGCVWQCQLFVCMWQRWWFLYVTVSGICVCETVSVIFLCVCNSISDLCVCVTASVICVCVCDSSSALRVSVTSSVMSVCLWQCQWFCVWQHEWLCVWQHQWFVCGGTASVVSVCVCVGDSISGFCVCVWQHQCHSWAVPAATTHWVDPPPSRCPNRATSAAPATRTWQATPPPPPMLRCSPTLVRSRGHHTWFVLMCTCLQFLWRALWKLDSAVCKFPRVNPPIEWQTHLVDCVSDWVLFFTSDLTK